MEWAEPVSDPALHAVLQQVMAAPVVVLAIEWAKSSKYFPWLTSEQKNVQRFLGFAFAVFTAANIHGNFAGSVLTGGDLTIHFGLIPAVFGLWHTANAWATQEFVYRAKQKLSN